MHSSLKVWHTSHFGFFKKGKRFDLCQRKAYVYHETKLVETDFDKWNMEIPLFHTFLYSFISLVYPSRKSLVSK